MTRSCSLWFSLDLLLELLLAILISSMFITLTSIHADPNNLLQNGGFEIQNFVFGVFPQKDVIHDGEMSFIPFFTVVHGGVQVLDATEYVPQSDSGGAFIIHLNYWYGPGVLISTPIVTPRKGAPYDLKFDIADNPDGGPLYKAIRVKILVNNEDADPVVMPFNVSSPESSRKTISWVRVGCTFIGTGESTTIQFESLVTGSFGVLIDNINVSMRNLVDNGSFEVTSQIIPFNDTDYYVLSAPSDMIQSWTITSGNIKYTSNQVWQSATDESEFMLDLNAVALAGIIASDPFPTRKGYDYTLLFDTAASPESSPPISGIVFGQIISQPGGLVLASSSVTVDGDGYSRASVGWQTYSISFTAEESTAIVEFMSKIPGGNQGPLLDNVLAYLVTPVGDYKSVGLTYGRAETTLTPSVWIITIFAALFSTWSLSIYIPMIMILL